MLEKPLVISQPTVGKLIRELRQLMGLTQKQFAAELGVVYPTINRWENGHITPSPMAMKLIEQKLNEIDEDSQTQLSKYWEHPNCANVFHKQGSRGAGEQGRE